MAQHRFKHEIVPLKWPCWKQGRCSNWSLGTPAVNLWLATSGLRISKQERLVSIRDEKFSEAGHVLGQKRNSWDAF